MISGFKNVLVLAPHTDDGELGAGGTISRLVELGACVTYVAFSAAEQSIPDGFPEDALRTEVRAATAALGIAPDNLHVLEYEVRKFSYFRQEILEDMIQIRAKDNYDLVLMPGRTDVHQDHKVIAEEGFRAFKGTSILGYELVWNNPSFDTTCFVALEKSHVEKKVAAMKRYESQAHRDYVSEDFLFSLARVRGVQIGRKYAEAFEVVRWVLS